MGVEKVVAALFFMALVWGLMSHALRRELNRQQQARQRGRRGKPERRGTGGRSDPARIVQGDPASFR